MRMTLEEFAFVAHPEKTSLIEFGRHAAADRSSAGGQSRRTFTYWVSPSNL